MRRGKAESTPSPPAVATAELQETILLDKAVEEEGAIEGGIDLACTVPLGNVIARGTAAFGRLLPRRKDVWFSQAKDVPKYRGLLYLQS